MIYKRYTFRQDFNISRKIQLLKIATAETSRNEEILSKSIANQLCRIYYIVSSFIFLKIIQMAEKNFHYGHDYYHFFQPVQMAPIRFSYKPRDLPREFDSRAKWTYLNNHILDQGWCGASWAFSTASVASDRFLIDSKGKTDENLCPRSIIACNTHGQSGCKGGSVDRAWSYLRKYG